MELIANELRAAAAGGKTVIVITHDPELFEVCCEYKIDITSQIAIENM